MLKYPLLFEPIRLGNTLFKNRIFSAPTGHVDSFDIGQYTDDAIAYFERKAMGGCAAITMGEIIVDSKYGQRHPFQSVTDNRLISHNFARIADYVSRHGAVLSAELQHSGMNAHDPILMPSSIGKVTYGPVDCVVNGKEIKEMPEDVIEYVIDRFAQSALFLKKLGFGMVTVHAGHGWLLNQFLSERVNTRKDKWGGSLENRARLSVAVVDAIHKLCGNGFPVEVRISASEEREDGYGIETGIAFAKQLEGHADLIHVSTGYSAFDITHPSMFMEDGRNVWLAAEIKKHVKNTPIATVGALADPALLEEILESGKADVVEMARGLVCDPDLPNKARAGKDEEIVKCMRCFACFSSLKDTGHFACALNPQIGRERESYRKLPASEKKKVLVIGGGIGGMQAALTAAEEGHEVILCEKTDKLGGPIRCEEKVPFKKKLKEYLDIQEKRVRRSAIDLRMNTNVTTDYALALRPDVIIAAVGASPIVPNIPGVDSENVHMAEDVYVNTDLAKGKITILGGGLVGTELAIYLHGLGKDVRIVEMADQLNDGGNFMHGTGVKLQIGRLGLEVHTGTKALSIEPGKVVCEKNGEKVELETDTVICAVGMKPHMSEACEFAAIAPSFHVIGDALRPSNIKAATSSAYTIAKDIGRFC